MVDVSSGPPFSTLPGVRSTESTVGKPSGESFRLRATFTTAAGILLIVIFEIPGTVASSREAVTTGIQGSTNAVRRTVPDSFLPRVQRSLHRTPLHEAARRGRSSSVARLLEEGASVDARDGAGATPLMYAAHNGDTEVFRVLLQEGASPTAGDKQGSTVLMYAVEAGHLNIAKRLVKAGASLKARGPSGNTALMVAALQGHSGIIEWLLRRGSNPGASDDFGMTAVGYALFGGHDTAANFLLNRDMSVRQLRRGPVLALAVRGGNQPMVKRLIDRGLDVDAAYWHGVPSLTMAVYRDRPQMLEFLLQHGADPSIRTRSPAQPDLTPFLVAGIQGNRRALKLLLEHGVHVDTREPDSGMTSLMYAVLYGQARAVKFLLRSGADPYRENRHGSNAFDIAHDRGFTRIYEVLRQHGQKRRQQE